VAVVEAERELEERGALAIAAASSSVGAHMNWLTTAHRRVRLVVASGSKRFV
jgi:hypothetical protein